jgi:alkylated DNA repair protein alkB family protein 8
MQLAHLIDQQKWIRLSNRKVQHYGYEFKYGVNSIDKEIHYNPIP